MRDPPRRLVYSTGPDGPAPDKSANCPRCDGTPCRCEPARSEPPQRQRIRVRLDRGGRRGKIVTVAGPLRVTREDALTLVRQLKKRCGAGGTLRRCDGATPAFEIEVQGDQIVTVLAELAHRGYPARRSGA